MLTQFFSLWFLLGIVALGFIIQWAMINENADNTDSTKGVLSMDDAAQPPRGARPARDVFAEQHKVQRGGR